MELQIGEYTVPEGLTAKMTGRVIRVYPSKANVLKKNEHRCKDCKHYGRGFCGTWYETNVCRKKPKGVKKGVQQYYHAEKYDRICEHFELREE